MISLVVANAANAAAAATQSATKEVGGLISKIVEFLSLYGLKVVGAILILILGNYLAKLAAKLVYKSVSKAGKGETLAKFGSSVVNAVIMTFVIIAVINKLGIETTSFLAVFGAAGLAIGLALQGSLGNLASGVLLIIFRPYNVGDGVQLGAVSGTVLDIQIFSTIIQTADNKKVIIPNGKITGDIITNHTVLGSRRLEVPFMISSALDLEKVRGVIRQILEGDERVLKSPAYDMIVAEWGDNIKLVVRPYVQPKDYDHLQSDLIEKVNQVIKALS